MLSQLRDLVEKVNVAESLQDALSLIVLHVCDIMQTQVCTVYMHEDDSQCLVLKATKGLNQAALNQTISVEQGLVGHIVRRAEMLNLEKADQHPAFFALPDSDEHQFQSFLGAPIIHNKQVLGVLVVQQKEKRKFDDSDEAFLITIAAQLAGVIVNAKNRELPLAPSAALSQKLMKRYKGNRVSTGVALGDVMLMLPKADLDSVPQKNIENVDAELALFEASLDAVRQEVTELGNTLSAHLPTEERALFDAYLGMLSDSALAGEIKQIILQGEWAQGAVSQVIGQHVRVFSELKDEYLKERASDVKDLGRRLLANLQQSDSAVFDFPDKTILVSEELTAAMLAEVPTEKLVGLVSVKGSRNSHAAILARSMGIPTIMGVDLPLKNLHNVPAIVDAYNGSFYIYPSEELTYQYQVIQREEQQYKQELIKLKDLPAQTSDGHSIELLANTGLVADINRSIDQGAKGVGLYRSEIPFLLRDRFPSEEEQRTIYRKHLHAFDPHPVVMRTLDIGGDKPLTYFPITEKNSALGWRGVRVTLDHPEIFLVQIRAMLKANAGLGNLHIMLPMISHLDELLEAKQFIMRAHAELTIEGIDIPIPEIGMMVEVPAVLYQANVYAQHVDFFSVGSNDLTQYLLAVDRTNNYVANLYKNFHPAVLHACQHIATIANKENVRLSICGELAGDPAAALLLMAMGFDSLSMNASHLLQVKAVLRSVSLPQAKSVLNHVLVLHTAAEVKQCLDDSLQVLGVKYRSVIE